MRGILSCGVTCVAFLWLCGCAEDGGALVLTDLVVEDNPGNVLSCFVRWTTDEPASSWVEFGESQVHSHHVGGDERVTDHEVLVFGLHANAEVSLQAVSEDSNGVEARSDELTYETAALPFESIVAEVWGGDDEPVQPGWTLAGFTFHQSEVPLPAYVVAMLDLEGEPVWYYTPPSGQPASELDVSLLAAGHVLIGAAMFPGDTPVAVDLAGEHAWEGPQQEDFLTPGYMHHAFSQLDNGHYLTLSSDFVDGNLTEVVWEFDAAGETAWTWNAHDHLDIPPGELSWLNAVTADLDRDVAHVNSRGQSLLMEVDRSDGHVIWSLGADGDFTAAAEHSWFDYAHAPEVQPDGNVLIHDNGSAERAYSRVVEYALDLDTMAASIVWEYPAGQPDEPWYSYQFGDANRLANGNTLITQLDETGDVPRCHTVEVTPDGEEVWELVYRSESSGRWVQAYTAVRIPVLLSDI